MKSKDIFTAIYDGMRFDLQFCSGFIGAYYLFSLLTLRFNFNKFVSKFIFNIEIFVIAFINLMFFIYFGIFRSNFDSNLFLFKHEEMSQLLSIAINDNLGILPATIIFLLFILLANKFHNFLFSIKKDKKLNYKQIAFSFLFVICFVLFGINQKFSFTQKILFDVIKAQDNHILQSSLLGHMKGFFIAVRKEMKKKNIDFAYFNIGTPKEAACKSFDINPCNGKINLYEYIKRVKNDELVIKPRKIYYIISESLSDWVMDDKFSELFSDIQNFVKSKATYIKALENASGTAQSLQLQFLGIYFNEEDNLYYYNKIITPKTSLASHFNQIGYKSFFYMGNTKNWSNVGDLGKKTGFINEYHKDNMITWARKHNLKEPLYTDMGILDDVALEYLAENSKDNSFNVLMTITNHKIYDLAFMQKNDFVIPFDKIEKLSTKYKNELATIYWYQKTLVNWIEKTAQNEPDSLFVITGDHYGRFNIDDSNDLFITHSVPVIMYYPKAKIYPTCKITNHLDISASIINLIAPKGYEYFSFGSPCFSLEKKEILATNKYGFEIEFENGKITSGGGYLRMAQALSWYLVYKGNIIE
ncbi:sulfatase-like hydrolase/transferase [Campylobacter sp. 2018MI01]|uniref:LTA synthase family protein n=1 Tax=Campylobacter sp. 2018MI01 TaxID=2836735 RepID=UPI001BDA81AB|nr:sulfatase-like hydrolase/transferase [Campylobacter sp. 2018MI01]MBT0878301.1 sulfatase-like hydrolase/transferase [Campylobacter sp. 2018MI01]